MKIIYNYPSKSRPSLFRRGVDNIINNSIGTDYEILAIVDENDPTLKDYDFTGCEVLKGKSKSKVDAINRGHEYILQSGADIIVSMSDDMVFTTKGFDNIIRKAFYIHYNIEPANSDDLDMCIHFPDGSTGDKLISMSILGIDYYKRFNYIYNPEYVSLYCDNETMDVAKILGKYKFVNVDIFKHLHPANGNAFNDAQYQYTESFYPIDGATYQRRKLNNFGL